MFISITESRLDLEVSDNNYLILHNYLLYRTDRETDVKCGICTWIRIDFQVYVLLSKADDNVFEVLILFVSHSLSRRILFTFTFLMVLA